MYREKDRAQVRRSLKEGDKHMNERTRQALVPGEQTKVGMKRSATRGSYTSYTSEERAKIGRYAAENGPTRATSHFAVPETMARRLKYEYLQRS